MNEEFFPESQPIDTNPQQENDMEVITQCHPTGVKLKK